MKFTPYSIKNQDFNKAMRGYDKDEVHAFLEKLADEVEALQSSNESLTKEVENLKEQLVEFKNIEKNLQNTLLSATESSTKAIDSAKKQTSLILKEAELKAAQIIEKAKKSANNIRESVLSLKEEKNLILARLKAMVNSQATLLEMDVETVERDQVGSKKIDSEEKDQINVDDLLERLL